MSNQEKVNSKSKYTKYIVILWLFVFLVIGTVVTVFTLISNGKLGYLPPFEEIENPRSKAATQVYSSDGEVLAKFFFSTENRVVVRYNQLSPYLVNALIATEDARFVKHAGIDFQSLARVLVKRIVLQDRSAGGGSTITQQLAKQLYSDLAENTMERTFQKLNEYVIAIMLEKYYTKEEIISMYFNKLDFLNNAVGIKTASQVYFNLSPDSLRVEQAAMLVGMCKNPSIYNPVRRPELVIGRRNVVFSQMEKAGYLSQLQVDSLSELPLRLDFHRVDHKTGPAPYFREFLRRVMGARLPVKANYRGWQSQQYLEDSTQWVDNPLFGWCSKNIKPNGEKYNLYIDGLKIYTTIDSRIQKYATEAVVDHLSKDLQPKFDHEKEGRTYAPFNARSLSEDPDLRQKAFERAMWRAIKQTPRYYLMHHRGESDEKIEEVFKTPTDMSVFSWKGTIDTIMTPWDSIRYHKQILRSAIMAMDPSTGHVKAYVGGPDFNFFQYDMVTLGRRQVGSTIKPFLYTKAMQEGYTPCYEVLNQPITVIPATGIPWTPRNSDDDRRGEKVTLKWGLANSNNFISAWIMNQFKPEAVAQTIHNMGIKSHIDAVPSLCLGTSDFRLEEMVASYCVFANAGVHSEPMYVTRIEDKNGNPIASFRPRTREVISEQTAYLMINMLQGVVRIGTGIRLRFRYGLLGEIGGKTGTTQEQSDGWFMGVTPNLVGGVWTGGEDRAIHFDNITYGQGANMALPVWAMFMQKVYDDPTLNYSREATFERPEGFNIELDCNKTKVPSAGDRNSSTSVTDEDLF